MPKVGFRSFRLVLPSAPPRETAGGPCPRHGSPLLVVLFAALSTILASCRLDALMIPDIRSQTVHRLTAADYSQIAWSPDLAQFLAVGLLDQTGRSDLYLVDAQTGRANKFSDVPDQYLSPRWSPDSTRLAFTVWPDEVWLYDVQSRELTLVSQGEGGAWSPNGGQLAVYVGSTVTPPPSNPQMRFVDLSGALLQSIDLGAIGVIRQSPSQGGPPLDAHEYLAGITWSTTPNQVAFSVYTIVIGGEDTYQAFLLDLQSDQLEPFLPDQHVGAIASSPHGDYIAYIRMDTDEVWGTLVLADSTGTCLFVPDIPSEVRDVTWSQDGQQLAFIFHNAIHVMDVPQALGQVQPHSGCP
jgi:WD40 repeat protein